MCQIIAPTKDYPFWYFIKNPNTAMVFGYFLSNPNRKFWIFQIAGVGVGGNGKFSWGKIFFTRWWESNKEWFWQFKHVLNLKTKFWKYWTSIKILISMTCVYKIKVVEEQWLQLKMKYLIERINLWSRVGSSERMSKYLARENSKTTHGLYQGALTACPASQMYWKTSVIH